MRRVFVDSAYHVALLDPHDSLHERARRLGTGIARESNTLLVTTEVVLIETLTFLSAGGPGMRREAARYAMDLERQSRVDVVPQTAALYREGLHLYAARLDKKYSMVDCISMVVCSEQAITDVLTYDSDFPSEGFRALLRE